MAGTKTKEKKSVIEKVAIRWSSIIDFCMFLLNIGSLKNTKNEIFWLILVGAIVTRVLNACLKFWVNFGQVDFEIHHGHRSCKHSFQQSAFKVSYRDNNDAGS